jgi:hypothetical protein
LGSICRTGSLQFVNGPSEHKTFAASAAFFSSLIFKAFPKELKSPPQLREVGEEEEKSSETVRFCQVRESCLLTHKGSKETRNREQHSGQQSYSSLSTVHWTMLLPKIKFDVD